MSAWAMFDDAGSRLDDTIKIELGCSVVNLVSGSRVRVLREVHIVSGRESNKLRLKPDLNRPSEI
jgi:hypothetical protein